MAVHPDQQGTGIGRQLINITEQKLMKLDCPKVNLQVRSTNTQLVHYYKTLGYEEDNAIGMGKRLTTDD